MREGGFEPPKALSHEIPHLVCYFFYRKSDILSLAHLTTLLPPLPIVEKESIIKLCYSLLITRSINPEVNGSPGISEHMRQSI